MNLSSFTDANHLSVPCRRSPRPAEGNIARTLRRLLIHSRTALMGCDAPSGSCLSNCHPYGSVVCQAPQLLVVSFNERKRGLGWWREIWWRRGKRHLMKFCMELIIDASACENTRPPLRVQVCLSLFQVKRGTPWIGRQHGDDPPLFPNA